MSVNRIYQCLWQLLHYLVSLYEVCLWVRLRVIAFALWSYDLCQTQTKLKKNEFEFLRRCKSQLEKIPKHLNLIIGPEAKDVNEELLTRLFSYALYMNIECISFYDTRSIAVAVTSSRETNKSIDLNKLKCPEGWKSKNINDNRAVWYCIDSELSNGSKSHTNGCVPTSLANNCSKSTNGHLTSDISKTRMKSLEIYQIQPKDNQALIAEVCRNLFRQRHTKEVEELLKQKCQLTERLDKEMSHLLEHLSEPELSIVFSETLCTFGTLPWHTRFTEFQRFVTGQRFDAQSFAHILYRYSRCEQRWGK